MRVMPSVLRMMRMAALAGGRPCAMHTLRHCAGTLDRYWLPKSSHAPGLRERSATVADDAGAECQAWRAGRATEGTRAAYLRMMPLNQRPRRARCFAGILDGGCWHP